MCVCYVIAGCREIIIIIQQICSAHNPPCWVLKARIQKHRDKLLLFHDKCPGLFYVLYTTSGTYSFTSHPKDEAIMVKCFFFLKDTSAVTGQAGIRTHILTTPEIESNALNRSATTLICYCALDTDVSQWTRHYSNETRKRFIDWAL